MKTFLSLLTSALLITVIACGDNNGEEACQAYDAKCPAGVGGSGTCDANKINDASNGDNVESCVKSATNCSAATACLANLR